MIADAARTLFPDTVVVATEDPAKPATGLFPIEESAVARAIDKRAVVEAMVEYAARSDAPVKAIGRHMLGMFGGQPGAKIWRRTLSETMHLPEAGPHTLLEAFEAMSRRPAHV
jgi:tRNA-dihydrouridine synthase